MPDVDLVRHTITVASPKGGPERAFTRPLPKALQERLTQLKAERPDRSAWDWPPAGAKHFSNFFRRVQGERGIPRYCFHCLRVTYISRGIRSGVPENMMMRLVNHASTTINRIYQRHNLADLATYDAMIKPLEAAPDAAGKEAS
jgi:integrase